MGFGKDGKGVIIGESRAAALGTLAPDTGILITTKLATLERFRMLKARMVANVEGITAGEAGGLTLWLADGDLVLSEIEEAIEADGPLGPNDKINEAIAERPVWYAGGLDVQVSVSEAFFRDAVTAGYACMVKPRWTFARTKSWNWVVYNAGPALSTGATVNIRCKDFGVWVT